MQSKLRNKVGPKYKALKHFDDFYGSVFGKMWEPMREGLLRKSKYVAVINNYADAEETVTYLSNRGAHCLKQLMEVQKEFDERHSIKQPSTETHSGETLEEFMAKVETDDIASIYSGTDKKPERLVTENLSLGNEEEKKQNNQQIEPNKTLEESIKDAELDESRLIYANQGISSEALYQYIPATKIKGLDEWIPESQHYSYYTKGQDFPLTVEPETEFSFPEHLKVYTFEMDSECTSFPEPKRGQTGVKNYYPMDGGSVAVVLALCLRAGDRVLDLCSGPGGKALVALQTLLPDIIICNDVARNRCNRIERVFAEYLYDYQTSNKWQERVLITNLDGHVFYDEEGFDKVLVDVPCTGDRHALKENENNIFRPDRIKERLKIPEVQAGLLVNALSLVKVGGAVVYSTCSLSPIQNDGVVHMALKQAFETRGIIANIRDLTPCMSSLSGAIKFGSGVAKPKYGQLVVPDTGANFGPSYFSRLVRTK